MSKQQMLNKKLSDLMKATSQGKIKWEVNVSTTEYNDKKQIITENNEEWTVDEIYVSYKCEYQGEEFLLISYEMIHSCGDKKQSTNLIFLPPLGIRYFDLATLLPYTVEADNMLTYEVHSLWVMLLDMFKQKNDLVKLDIDERELVIEE